MRLPLSASARKRGNAMGKKFWGDVLAFVVFVLSIGGFVTAVGHHYLTAPPGAPLAATVYEDGSWVDDDKSGCIEGAACDDKSHGETVPIVTSTPRELEAPDLTLCEEDAGYPCFDDFGDATVYEDGSWTDAEGNSGCIKGALCDDESHGETYELDASTMEGYPACTPDIPDECVWADPDVDTWFFAPKGAEYDSDAWVYFPAGQWAYLDADGTFIIADETYLP